MDYKNKRKTWHWHDIETKLHAKQLRKWGFTHSEIAKELDISNSTAWEWTKGIYLSREQKKAIQERVFKAAFTPARRAKLARLGRKNFSSFWKKPYTKKDLIQKIRNFYSKNGRIPLKREFNMYREYQKRFGSWNKAIVEAGFKPNKVIFTERFIAKDSHICDSFAEKVIDDWLAKNKIKHERHIPYGRTKMTADFLVGDKIIEYFGLVGASDSYRKIIEKKRALSKNNGRELIELYPNKLFTGNFRSCLQKLYKRINS